MVAEEERMVLPDRTAQAVANAVVLQLSLASARAVVRPTVRVQVVILMVPITDAVKIIGASRADQRHLAAGRSAERRIGVGDRDAKLADRIPSHRRQGKIGT